MNEAVAVISSHTFIRNDRDSEIHAIDTPCASSRITASFILHVQFEGTGWAELIIPLAE